MADIVSISPPMSPDADPYVDPDKIVISSDSETDQTSAPEVE